MGKKLITFRLVTFLVLLACIHLCCLKPVELDISPQQDFVVFGDIGNTSSTLSVSALNTESSSSEVTTADIYIDINGNRHNFKIHDGEYKLLNTYIPPNVPYNLIVEIDDIETVFTGQLPDTVRKAELRLVQIKDFRYEFRLDVEVDESEAKYGYLWGRGNIYTSKSFTGNTTIGYEQDFLERFSKEQFYVAYTNPLRYNTDFKTTFQRVYAKTIDTYKVLFDNVDNRFNPLYIKYNPKSDIVVNNVLFRINEITSIETNTIRVEDNTPVLLECNIYLGDRQELNAEVYKNLQISMNPIGVNRRIAIPVGSGNPTTVSLNQLAPLIAGAIEDDLVFEELLNKPFYVFVQGEDLDGKRIGTYAEVTLTDLMERKIIIIELEKE